MAENPPGENATGQISVHRDRQQPRGYGSQKNDDICLTPGWQKNPQKIWFPPNICDQNDHKYRMNIYAIFLQPEKHAFLTKKLKILKKLTGDRSAHTKFPMIQIPLRTGLRVQFPTVPERTVSWEEGGGPHHLATPLCTNGSYHARIFRLHAIICVICDTECDMEIFCQIELAGIHKSMTLGSNLTQIT